MAYDLSSPCFGLKQTLRIAFGSDERTHLTDFVEQALKSRGHQVELVGPPAQGEKGRS